MTDADCVAFLQWALPRLRMRWPGFRKVRRQVCKRIGRRMTELEFTDPLQYRAYLEGHPLEWKTLDSFCRITISRFFRDREVCRNLRDVVLPTLAKRALTERRSELRCWSAGCGSGEEPYTLSLLWRLPPDASLSGRFPLISFRVTASDSEPVVLERAQAAVYEPGTVKELPPSWIPVAFDESDAGLLLRSDFTEGVRFSELDIRQESPEGPFDLILCRNLVFTYFEEGLQIEILRRLVDRLTAGGCLVMGAHERAPDGQWPLTRPNPGMPIYWRLNP